MLNGNQCIGKIFLYKEFSDYENLEIHTKSLPSGVYFAFVISGKNIYTTKVLILH